MPLLNVDETAKELGCAPASLYSRAFRARLGLAATKIGSSVRFDAKDVARVLEASREKLPPMPEEGSENAAD
jgi:hypothetical protein